MVARSWAKFLKNVGTFSNLRVEVGDDRLKRTVRERQAGQRRRSSCRAFVSPQLPQLMCSACQLGQANKVSSQSTTHAMNYLVYDLQRYAPEVTFLPAPRDMPLGAA